MSELILSCPIYGFHAILRKGKIHHSQQNYKCNDCDCQFVDNPRWRKISDETKELINRLLPEKIPLAGQLSSEASVARTESKAFPVCKAGGGATAPYLSVLHTALAY